MHCRKKLIKHRSGCIEHLAPNLKNKGKTTAAWEGRERSFYFILLIPPIVVFLPRPYTIFFAHSKKMYNGAVCPVTAREKFVKVENTSFFLSEIS